MGRISTFESDRAEVAGAKQDVAEIREKVRSLEDQLLDSLGKQLGELSIALSGIRDLGAILGELKALRRS